MDLAWLSLFLVSVHRQLPLKLCALQGCWGSAGGLIISYTTLDCVKEKTFNEALSDYSKWHCLKKEQIEGGKIL